MITVLGIAIAFIGAFVALLSLAVWFIRKRYRALYQQAIASGDKTAALAAGRKYYGALRSTSRLNAADEQAIANDLQAMTDPTKKTSSARSA